MFSLLTDTIIMICIIIMAYHSLQLHRVQAERMDELQKKIVQLEARQRRF